VACCLPGRFAAGIVIAGTIGAGADSRDFTHEVFFVELRIGFQIANKINRAVGAFGQAARVTEGAPDQILAPLQI
jgi:hypothetical protein